MLRRWLERWSIPRIVPPAEALGIHAQVDDSHGWTSLNGLAHDYDPAQVQELYKDALAAWRKNPIAWRIIAITTDYVVGDRLQISSPIRRLERFIDAFWRHPQNHMDLRLETMCDELARSGDLFVLLFRNPQDGMSYIRFVTKDRIEKIESAADDWEQEVAYYERIELGEPRRWIAAGQPAAQGAQAVMLHYAVNRPLGALLGEGDLTSMLPWLQRYSRMLEDRVRLHWAIRSFLWMVTVPSTKVREKQEQYRRPPEAGSIIVKDESETWEAVTPQLHSSDASHDLRAVRQMIDAGSGYPPHWRGEAADANLATANAMQAPSERHLGRRQNYFVFILMDILFHAYQRAVEIDRAQPLASRDYQVLFTASLPDISRDDNESLARAARDIAQGLQVLESQLQIQTPGWQRLVLKTFLKFAGEPASEAEMAKILNEADRI